MNQLQTARFNGLDGLFRRQSQFRFWSARFAQDRCLLARTGMPVDNREKTSWSEGCAHREGQSPLIGNAVKSIRHKYEVSLSRNQFAKMVSIASRIVAIRHAAFGQTVTRHFQQVGVYVDCHDVTRDLGDLQREPPVAGDRSTTSARSESDGGKYAGRVGP